MSIKIDTQKVLRALCLGHDPRNWACISELRIGGGYGKDSEQRFDLWAINYLPSKQNVVRCFEIKVSRSDFKNEISKPRKRRAGLRLSNEFYFVVPEGLVAIEEVPPECGLIEVNERGSLTYTIRAPFRNTIPPTFNFIATICRRFDKERLRDYMDLLSKEELEREAQAAALRAIDVHVAKWKAYNIGNKEVPDLIAAALEDLKEEVVNIIIENRKIN